MGSCEPMAGVTKVPSVDIQDKRVVLIIENRCGVERSVCPNARCRTLSGEVVTTLCEGDTFYTADGDIDIDSSATRGIYRIDKFVPSRSSNDVVEIYAKQCSAVNIDGAAELADGLPQPCLLIGTYPRGHSNNQPWRSQGRVRYLRPPELP